MSNRHQVSRRSFLNASAAALGAAPFAGAFAAKIPVGLELYSVRKELAKDTLGTVTAVAKMGYQNVEFFSPYFQWTVAYAKQVRGRLDDLGIRCLSTHNGPQSFSGDGAKKALELNMILASRYIVMASPGKVASAEDWRKVADTLNSANDMFQAHKIHTGYHNHGPEWKEVDGRLPMEILASNTDKTIMLQLDVGTCIEMGHDPVTWINKNPGRIRSLHLKEWSREKGYRCLLGEGVADWKAIFGAAESKGGVEFYLVEQEGSDFSELETAERCLSTYRQLHG